MKRGSHRKAGSTNVTVWIPKQWKGLISQAIEIEDSDQSKFVRNAIKEKLARHNIVTASS